MSIGTARQRMVQTGTAGKGMITVHPAGPRRHLQPLAYPALASLFKDAIRLTENGDAAEIILYAHPRDLWNDRVRLFDWLKRRPDTRIVLLSEEPFWDTVGLISPFQRQQSLKTPEGPLAFSFLNHHNSRIFDFAHIPYFLLTGHAFYTRYARRFSRNRVLSQSDWAWHFAEAPLQAVFMAEHRDNQKQDVDFPQYDIKGLSVWRTRLAETYQTGAVLRAGKGWPQGSPDRTALRDWHLDKLVQLDRQSRFVSAIENTHQANYMSEKVFDAFAVGAVPLYYASPGHAIHRILPEGAWLNLYQTTPAEAGQLIDALTFDAAFLDGYAATQHRLSARFTSPELLVAERDRLKTALITEFQAVLEAGPSIV